MTATAALPSLTLPGNHASEDEILAYNIAALQLVMVPLGVARVHASYSGGGDEGQVDDIEFLDGQGQSVDLPPTLHLIVAEVGRTMDPDNYRLRVDSVNPRVVNAEAFVSELVNTVINQRAPMGWENNEGGYGSVGLELGSGELTFAYSGCEPEPAADDDGENVPSAPSP